MFWMRSVSCVSKGEEKAFSLHMLFVFIPLHKPCEKNQLYPIVKKLLTGQIAATKLSTDVTSAHTGSAICASCVTWNGSGQLARDDTTRE